MNFLVFFDAGTNENPLLRVREHTVRVCYSFPSIMFICFDYTFDNLLFFHHSGPF